MENLTEHEVGIAELLSDAWSGSFFHSFIMPRPRGPFAAKWVKWRRCRNPLSGEEWRSKNIQDACSQYAWDDISETKSEDCRKEMTNALQCQDAAALREACLKTFSWGGVGNRKTDKSRTWVYGTKDELLVERISAAVSLLKQLTDPSEHFDGRELLINSAMTKVYTFADSKRWLSIYDGRVGAALALFAARYCRKCKLKQVPSELLFRWGDTRNANRIGSRNPSSPDFQFPRLNSKGDKRHAYCMWRSSRILNKAALLAKCSSTDLERALFMIGYDVSKSVASTTR